jgi:hypothetical protein
METGEHDIPRRTFLGAAGSIAIPDIVPEPCDATRSSDAKSSTPIVSVPVRRLAVDPKLLGTDWRLQFDLVLDTTAGSAHAVMSDTTAQKPLAEAMGGKAAYIAEAARGDLRECAELGYFAERDGRRFESYYVKVWLFNCLAAAESAWRRSFAAPAEAGFVLLEKLGEQAYESHGGWSIRGKLVFRRFNVVTSVLGLGQNTSTRWLAEQFDRRLQELASR